MQASQNVHLPRGATAETSAHRLSSHNTLVLKIQLKDPMPEGGMDRGGFDLTIFDPTFEVLDALDDAVSTAKRLLREERAPSKQEALDV